MREETVGKQEISNIWYVMRLEDKMWYISKPEPAEEEGNEGNARAECEAEGHICQEIRISPPEN